jgi:tetratricopeptide (TPR) repeat protein
MIDNRWPLALAVGTLVTRVAYIASVARDPFFGYLRHVPDSHFFNNWAQEIASGSWLGGDGVFFIGPLYAYFLASIYRLVGPDLIAVRIVQVILEIASALFIYGFARRAVGERAARVAGVIWALYLPAIFFSSLVLPVSLGTFLITASFYFLARGVEGRWWSVAAAGSLLGLAALDRGNLLLYALASIPVFLIRIWRIRWSLLLAYFIPIITIILAVTVRNGVVAGDFVPISSQAGLNFYIGNSAPAKGIYWSPGDVFDIGPAELNRDLATFIAEKQEGRELRPSEVQRFWLGEGLAWLADNPRDAAALYGRKLRLLVNDYEPSLNVDFYFMKFISPAHRFQVPWFGFVLPFAIIGLVVGWRKAPLARVFGAVFVLAYALSVLLFFVSARYRLLMVPMLIVFAAFSLVGLYDLWRKWRWRAAAATTAAAVALSTLSAWPIPDLPRDYGFGQTYYRYGKYYFELEDYERATSYFYKSTVASPELYQSVLMLALSYERLGRFDDALAMYEHGIRLAPDKPMMFHNYGVALARAGRYGEAVAAFERAVEVDPGYWQSWLQLVDIFVIAGDYRLAELACRNAVEILPEDAGLRVRHAELFLQMGRAAEALTAARTAINIDARIPGANLIAGGVYYEKGDYRKALGYLEREAVLQPGSAKVSSLLALTYFNLGDLESSRRAYETRLELGGSRDPAFEKEVGMTP